MTTVGQVRQYRDCIFEPGDIVEVRAIASGGRVRKFWRKAQDLPGLIATLGADPACKNPERLMRLPGFSNRKYQPFVDCFTMFTSGVN